MEPEEGTAPVETAEPPAEGGAPESAPQESQSAVPSFEDAITEARAQLSQPSDDGKPEPSKEADAPKPAGDATNAQPEPAQETQPESGLTTRAQLDRLRTMVEQGREHELSARERGLLQTLEANGVRKFQTEREAFELARAGYVEALALRQENAQAYTDWLSDPTVQPDGRTLGQHRLQFVQDMAAKHPDITLEKPHGNGPDAPVSDPRRIAEKTASEFFDRFDRRVEGIWEKAGMPADGLAKLYEQAADPYEYLESVTDQIVAHKLEAEVAKRMPEEIKAAKLEAQAAWAPERIISPRHAGGLAADGKTPVPTGPLSVEQAFRQAKEVAAAAS